MVDHFEISEATGVDRIRAQASEFQSKVHAELSRLDTRAGEMYLGVIRVLGQDDNPDRVSQAAHSLRQIIEKLGEWLGAPLKVPGTLGGKVRDLREKWDPQRFPSVFETSTQAGAPDPFMHSFLREVRTFFDWYDNSEPNRREAMGRFFARLEPSGRRLPFSVERILTRQWSDLQGKLSGIAHHNCAANDSSVRELLDAFGGLVLERVRPRTFERQDEIDRIITEAEGGT